MIDHDFLARLKQWTFQAKSSTNAGIQNANNTKACVDKDTIWRKLTWFFEYCTVSVEIKVVKKTFSLKQQPVAILNSVLNICPKDVSTF